MQASYPFISLCFLSSLAGTKVPARPAAAKVPTRPLGLTSFPNVFVNHFSVSGSSRYLMNRRSDELFQEHAMGKKYKKCPNCNAWTVRLNTVLRLFFLVAAKQICAACVKHEVTKK